MSNFDLTDAPGLTSAQLGIYIDSLRFEGTNIYHTPHLACLHGVDDAERLLKAVNAAISAYPSMSARIMSDDSGTPRLIDASSTETRLRPEMLEMSERELRGIRNNLVEPFDLHGGPLARIKVIKTESHIYLFTDFHHTIFDGHSHKLLLKAIDTAYKGGIPESESLTIFDLAREEADARKSASLSHAHSNYSSMLEGADSTFDMAGDISGATESYSDEKISIAVSGQDYRNFCTDRNLPQSVPATAAMGLVLQAFYRRDDVTFATIYHGRKGHRYDTTFGMMVKTLPVRISTDACTSIHNLLQDCATSLKCARDNDLYSFAEAAQDFGVNSDFLFAYQGSFLDMPEVNGAPAEEIPVEKVATGSKVSIQMYIEANDSINLAFEYRSDLFSPSLVRTMAECYQTILSELISAKDDVKVSSLPLAPADKLSGAARMGNGGKSKANPEATIPQLFAEAATRYPDNIAVVYNDTSLTYRELDRMTDSLAYLLRDVYGVSAETVVGVLIERSELMAVYPMAIMKAGGTYMPLDPHFPEERLMFMVKDAGVGIILDDEGLAARVIPSFEGKVVSPSAIPAQSHEIRKICEARPEDAMVVLYTSGSTGKPKGVTLTQHNLVNYCTAYTGMTGLKNNDKVGAYASFGFDAHMMDLYPTLLTGATLHIFNPEMRLDLTAMHDYIESQGITVLFMTTQIAWQMATLFDFTSLRVLSCGGEKLPPIGRLPYTFFNLYGPTECSVAATAYKVEGATDGKIIGRPLNGYKLTIVDKYFRPLPVGVPGELIIAGDGVGRGYLNRPELNREKFISFNGESAYRTGDHARFLADGNIEFIGRIDGMVKLRGLRIELGEIEAVANSHPDVKTFVAAVKQIGAMENLTGYFVPREGASLSAEALREYMSANLTEFMIPSAIMQLDKMPLTPNGKIDRRALPVPEIAAEELVAPATDMERKVFNICADVLGHDNFGVTGNLLSAGLTSLMAMRLVASIMKNTGVRITAKMVMSAPTVRQIAETIQQAGTAADTSSVIPTNSARRRYYPLTENQRGVYVDWEMNREALQYNIPQAFKFAPGTDAERLRQAVRKVLSAHPGLKTRLTLRNGDVMQERHDDEETDIRITQLDTKPDAEFFQSCIKPFNLLGEPLFRCEIFCHGSDVYMLRDTHHIIFDGVSAMVFYQELTKAYGGDNPEAETYSALDHALYEKELLQSDEADKAAAWFDTLLGDSESTSYPHSARPDADSTHSGSMGRLRVKLPAHEIRRSCSSAGITVSNYMLSAFLQLLHRLTREECVQITTVNNGRADLRLLGDTGMFVKTLPVVSRCKQPTESPTDFARRIQNQFLTSQDYDFYPFTALVESKHIRPEIMYVYEGGIDMTGSGNDTLKAEKIPLALDTAKVPLTLLVFEPSDKEFELCIEYDRAVYSIHDMQLLLDMMSTLSQSLTAAATIGDAVMVNAGQRQQLEAICHGKTVEIPFKSMHGAMEAHADANPDAPALVACDKRMTYGEFDRECNRIANALIVRGVRHGDRVVILLPRRSSLITAIYGTMKAGATYIPCDPDYPADRIRLITEDSEARFIITTADRVELYPTKALDINDLLAGTDDTRPNIHVNPEDVAYMIYTSGSTGRPKGVMIPQRGITNYLYGYYDMFYRERPEVKVEMLLVTISFDASLNNLGVSFASGHCLVLANEDECKDVVLLSRLMLDNSVDSTDITPSRLEAMLELPEFRLAISRCKHLNIGGEGFQSSLIDKLFDAGFTGLAINEYGPTETTVGSNQASLRPGHPIVAGGPFYNDTQRIVDAWGGELPVGVVGELYIFGRGVGLGYNKLPEKTAESFVDYHGEHGYRTGDLARWTPEGDVVILGRIDHQVKLRGLRIELGEIEAVAETFPGISKAAADVREVNKIQHLCLYYTASGNVDKEALRTHLSGLLTEYMVPDAYTQVDAMPLTPNGKTNRKALPEPETAPLTPYAAPEGEQEIAVAKAFAKVLQLDRVGANDDFFSIGGTSISAIKVVAALAAAGYNITYKTVFVTRTPRALAAAISGEQPKEATQHVATAASRPAQVSQFADVLNLNTLDSFLNGQPQELGDVFLTGATGFMGIHMLHDILTHTDAKVCCLLRSKGQVSAESRLRTLLFYYFDQTFESDFTSGRISVIEGDVTSTLPETILRPGLRTVINCAANVKHFSAGNDIETVNVESVRYLIDFCLKHELRLIHISTVSIAGESVNGYPDPSLLLSERMMDFGQNLSNQYAHSKYEAERLILTAISERGLSAKIMRVGNLSARGYDGEFQINFRSNAFMGKLRAYVALGCAPYPALDAPCEFSPIDEVCRAIMLLASTPKALTVFHPCNNHRLPLGDVLHLLGLIGHHVQPVEADEFRTRETAAMNEADKVDALQPLMAYESGSANTTFIRYDATFTNQILYRLDFRWNYTSHDYVSRFLKAIDALNFFAV